MAKTSLNVKILECDWAHLCALNKKTYFSISLEKRRRMKDFLFIREPSFVICQFFLLFSNPPLPFSCQISSDFRQPLLICGCRLEWDIRTGYKLTSAKIRFAKNFFSFSFLFPFPHHLFRMSNWYGKKYVPFYFVTF